MCRPRRLCHIIKLNDAPYAKGLSKRGRWKHQNVFEKGTVKKKERLKNGVIMRFFRPLSESARSDCAPDFSRDPFTLTQIRRR